jgi:hypothetical protein
MGERIFEKLARPEQLHRHPIFVFAADAPASVGLTGLGQERSPRPHPRTRPEYLDLLRAIVADGYIDGLLMAPADAEALVVQERLFAASPVTPMVRMNAETGIWNPRHGAYRQQPSYPFPTVPVPDAQFCEGLICEARECHVRLGLYSITLNNDVRYDEATLTAYLRFAREVGNTPGFDHVLEVFLPNLNLPGLDRAQRGEYVADSIVRLLSYLRSHQRPLFIKTEFTTPEVWRALCDFDPTVVIGALGGPYLNSRATLQLAYEVIQNGGRVILFGRTIFLEQNPRLICRYLRAVLDGQMAPDQAHAEYQAEMRQGR